MVTYHCSLCGQMFHVEQLAVRHALDHSEFKLHWDPDYPITLADFNSRFGAVGMDIIKRRESEDSRLITNEQGLVQ